ncbi:hypothetical protein F4V91_25155 [Neorhizobium galegae]|uniref:Uncharacterized protein n=1 Tax=Neorhizobium galegae TaxID=399 RepID=A0A6A1TGA6_NEOGA|nr:hypothetical protein [Neorhizobium galegae]KAB1082964.1 hypothetical protein F4V91_25155 [Neorhizobium galegae]
MNARLSKTASAEESISAFGVPTARNNASAMNLRGPRPWVQLDRRTIAVSLALLSALWILGAAILVYLLTWGVGWSHTALLDMSIIGAISSEHPDYPIRLRISTPLFLLVYLA